MLFLDESKPEVLVTRDAFSIRIYIGGLLHLELRAKNHDGLQSWLDGTKKCLYYIEFYRKKGRPILLEYENYGVWKDILTKIEKII